MPYLDVLRCVAVPEDVGCEDEMAGLGVDLAAYEQQGQDAGLCVLLRVTRERGIVARGDFAGNPAAIEAGGGETDGFVAKKERVDLVTKFSGESKEA